MLVSSVAVLEGAYVILNNTFEQFNEISNDFHVFARASVHAGAETYGIRRGQGGTAIFWRKSLGGVSPYTGISHDRFCAKRLETENTLILNIFSAYLPDTSSNDDFETNLDELSCAIDQMETGSQTILCGDLNGDVGNSMGNKGIKTAKNQGKTIVRFAERYHLFPVNMDGITSGPVHTYEGPFSESTLDYVMIPHNMRQQVINSRVAVDEILNTSDHRPVEITLDLKDLIPKSFDIQKEGKLKWSKINPMNFDNPYRVETENGLNIVLNNLQGRFISNDILDSAFERVTKVLKDADKNVPRSNFKQNIKPFWNDDLTRLKKEKNFHYNNWKRSDRPRNADNPLYVQYKKSKLNFLRQLRKLSREYEEKEIAEIIKSTEIDYKFFWKALKKSRSKNMVSVLSIKADNGQVKHDIEGVLGVWHMHFSNLCTPKTNDDYDHQHFQEVNAWVEEKAKLQDQDNFLEEEFTVDEISKAIKCLHKDKAPGFDDITTEHIVYASDILTLILCLLFNACIRNEYVPICFKRGVQIPLFKGKNACSLDPNNYRGITLLSSFNKLFEVLLWSRLELWWTENRIISDCQGACRKGTSSIHSAFMLQEAVATSRETGNKCFVAYFDVAKAFDSVWINGLFRQLYDLGVTGKIWRILRKAYIGFKCRVRIYNKVSEWYEMYCGIHQGGFLSSVKYISFINSLLEEIKHSNLCKKYQMFSCWVR